MGKKTVTVEFLGGDVGEIYNNPSLGVCVKIGETVKVDEEAATYLTSRLPEAFVVVKQKPLKGNKQETGTANKE